MKRLLQYYIDEMERTLREMMITPKDTMRYAILDAYYLTTKLKAEFLVAMSGISGVSR